MRILAAVLALLSAGVTLTASSVAALAEEPPRTSVRSSDSPPPAQAGGFDQAIKLQADARPGCGAASSLQLNGVQLLRD